MMGKILRNTLLALPLVATLGCNDTPYKKCVDSAPKMEDILPGDSKKCDKLASEAKKRCENLIQEIRRDAISACMTYNSNTPLSCTDDPNASSPCTQVNPFTGKALEK